MKPNLMIAARQQQQLSESRARERASCERERASEWKRASEREQLERKGEAEKLVVGGTVALIAAVGVGLWKAYTWMYPEQTEADKAAWARPSRVDKLEWEIQAETKVADGHSVKLVDCSKKKSSANERAVDELKKLLKETGSDALSRRLLSRVVLVLSRAREDQLFAKMADLNFKYGSDKPTFSLELPMKRGSAIDIDARKRTLDWFHTTYQSLTTDYPNVKALLAFHVTPSEEIAEQVLLGNFAVLQTVDKGFFGQGIYLTTDPEYAIEEYGRGVFGLARVPLLVCVVVVGNYLPVVESPQTPEGFLGKAIVGKADSHIVRVAKDPAANGGDTSPLPCLPARWAAVQSFSEIVVRDESQILPLGYVVV